MNQGLVLLLLAGYARPPAGYLALQTRTELEMSKDRANLPGYVVNQGRRELRRLWIRD